VVYWMSLFAILAAGSDRRAAADGRGTALFGAASSTFRSTWRTPALALIWLICESVALIVQSTRALSMSLYEYTFVALVTALMDSSVVVNCPLLVPSAGQTMYSFEAGSAAGLKSLLALGMAQEPVATDIIRRVKLLKKRMMGNK